MKRSIPFLLLILSTTCLSAQDNGALSSQSASYNGNTLELKGNVSLDHGLGKLFAEEALLDKHEAGKEFPFAQIRLKKTVNMILSETSSLTCEEAELDFNSLKGKLHGPTSPIVFKDMLKTKKKTTCPLELKSTHANLTFVKDSQSNNSFEIDHLHASDHVVIHYQNDFVLTADEASYDRAFLGSSKRLQGILNAYKKGTGEKCVLSHKGDEIFCDTATADTVNSLLKLQNADGNLTSSFLSQSGIDKLHFNCQVLTWDTQQNLLKLKGSVEVCDPVLGTLVCEDEVLLHETVKDGQRFVDKMRAKGFTTLDYIDSNSQKKHKLVSHGTLDIDRLKKTGKVLKPSDLDMNDEGKQIYYEEENFTLTADHADIDYSEVGNKIEPTLIRLRGNVRISSHDPSRPPKCGICDQATYSPSTQTIIMMAEPGKKALFWDEEQHAKISSREVHITQDPTTKKDVIRGIGQVQFSFNPQEQSLLEKIFPFLVE